jgi:hypothetical protein
MKRTMFLLPVLLLSSGCAGILHGTTDKISINSMEEDTVIYVDGIPRGKDYASGHIERGDDHTIRVSKAGCQDVTMETTSSFDPATLLGIFLDYGIISMPVDFISGAAWKTDQESVTLTPICPPKAPAAIRTALPPMPARPQPLFMPPAVAPAPPPPPARPQAARAPTWEEAWQAQPNRNILAR